MERKIPSKENLTTEFKSDLKKYPDSDLFEDIVAFANTEGGNLYLGVEDDGQVTGIHQDHQNTTTLSAYIANNTVPPLSVRTELIDEIKPVLKISVAKFQGGIVATSSGKTLRRRLKHDNTPENVPMYPTEMSSRLSDLRRLDYSEMPIIEASVDDFDSLEIDRLKRIILSYNGDNALLELNNLELFKALGFVREQDKNIYPTVTGILMLGKEQSIKKFVPTAKSSFQVLEGTKIRVNEDMCLPILATLEKMITYLEARNSEQEIEIGLFRMAIPEFNKQALREAIVNAFSHRDYTKMGRIRVAMDDDGLTIANPGGFIEGVTIENLLTAEPYGRNQLLADALKRVGLAEKTGRGIDRIFEGSLIYGSPLPDYSASTTTTVSLFIPRSKPNTQLAKIIADEQKKLGRPLPINTLLVLNKLKEIPKSDIKQLSNALNLNETLIKIVLDKAIESGIVEAYGAGRGRNYILAKHLFNDKSKNIGYVRQNDINEKRYEELIISLAQNNQFISRSDVVNLLHVNEDKAYTLLKALVNKNKLEPINKGRYSKYSLKV